MNREIKNALDAAADITRTAPDTREQYMTGLEAAQDAQMAAAQAKEEATTEADFDKACEAEARARDKVAFYEKRLESLKYTARMDEAVYQRHVNAIQAAVESAAAEFRRTAEKAMDAILAARAAYLDTVTDADRALMALDDAANVLQTRYRYRVLSFAGAPDKLVEDDQEWQRHALRYNTGTGLAYDLIARSGDTRNARVCAAWKAAQNADSTCADQRYMV